MKINKLEKPDKYEDSVYWEIQTLVFNHLFIALGQMKANKIAELVANKYKSLRKLAARKGKLK